MFKLFNSPVFNRFREIHNYLTDTNTDFMEFKISDSYSLVLLYKTIKTKLGARKVSAEDIGGAIYLRYFDKDDSVLFSIAVSKGGKVEIIQSKIDEAAIFSAIYELECIVHNRVAQKRGDFLERMFSCYRHYPFSS